ncbi:MAG: flavodoxin-dependent (E)-4-hydroxy-3-methylbut-2-enyl-diphosphate synthase [Bacteroidales bacterium]|nr:flavodoxin-dependent (E)-4-hydroxy-3-methylbut-2-enyl-diphosphate synthase [Bacteroidales bacterium]
MGIGALLADGIGDTIRVSLTEDPVSEVPVAQKIISYFDHQLYGNPSGKTTHFLELPHHYQPEITNKALPGVNEKPPLVINRPGKYPGQKPDLLIDEKNLPESFALISGIEDLAKKEVFKKKHAIIFETNKTAGVFEFREFFRRKRQAGSDSPVILKKKYTGTDISVEAGIDFGTLFLDGFGDGLWIDSNQYPDGEKMVELSFQILQACGARITQTEFIACPSCGRTQYDIQSSLEAIKSRTAHLKGLKIAVMGCIVNGPGEMADADYGYVGMGAGKVALFKGKKLLKKSIPQEEAVEQLIHIIKENGDWKDDPLTPISG